MTATDADGNNCDVLETTTRVDIKQISINMILVSQCT